MFLSKQSPHQEEQKQSPQGQRAPDDRFLALAQESANVFWCLSPEGSMQDVCSSWHTFTGQQERDCLGRGWLDAVHPADQPQLENALRQAATTGQAGETECHLRRTDGTYRLIRMRLIPVRIPNGATREIIVCGTDIPRQELAGKMSDAQLQLAVKVSGVGMWDWDPLTNQLVGTDQMKALFGLPANAPISHESLLAAIHPEDRERVAHMNTQIQKKAGEYQRTYRVIWPDGSVHWLSGRARSIAGVSGKPLHIVGAVVEITELKQAEERITSLLDNMTDAFLHVDTQWRLTYLNRQAERYMGRGVNRKGVLGQNFWEVAPDLLGTSIEHQLRDAMATLQAMDFDALGPREPRWFEVHVCPAYDGLSIYFHDISERKQAEAALQQSREELHLLMDTIPQLVWTAQPEGFLDSFNQQCMAYMNTTSEELTGDQWLRFLHPEDRHQVMTVWETALQTGQAYEREFRLREGKTGAYRWFLVRAAPITAPSGQIWKWVGTCTDIHEKKSLEEALRESEVRFRHLVQSNIIGITVIDLEGPILEANDAFLSLLGYTQQDLAAGRMNWRALTPPEHQERSTQAVKEVRTTGMAQLYEKEYIAKDGRRVPVLVGTVFFRRAGSTRLAISFVLDLTARKAMEEQKEEAHRQVTAILESITDAFSHVDRQWRYTYVNRGWEKLMGKKREEVVGRSLWDLLPALLSSPFERTYREAFATQQPAYIEGFHPDFRRWLDIRVYPTPDGLSFYLQDITERKQAEEALRESEARFRGLVDSNLIGITVSEPEGTIREANNAFLDLVGYTREDLAAGQMQWATLTAPEYQAQHRQTLEELLTTGMIQPFEKELVTKDGRRVPVLVGRTLFRRDQATALVIGFVLDQTARKESERHKDLMLGMTSHELKTPLAALKGTFQLLQRRVKRLGTREDNVSPEMRAFLADLSERLAASARQVDVQTHLINDLLDVSRITANTLKLERERCDLTSVVRQSVEDLRVLAPERSLLLEVPEHTEVHVLADRDRISQVVTNYVTNALRYSPSDQPVQIGLIVQEDMARVWVRDRGPGLSKEAQKEIWQHFHQAREVPVLSGSGKGLGLGLYICQMLITHHQGEVGVESTLGEGSTFWFTLPLVP